MSLNYATLVEYFSTEKDARAEALAEILALDAERRPAIQDFRKRALRGRTLASWERAVRWIEQRAATERATAGGDRPPVLLAFARPDREHVDHVPARPGSELARLRELSRDLFQAYGWQEARAPIFVLAGIVPPLPLATAEVTQRRAFPAASTISITARPGASVREIRDLYAVVRAELIGPKRRRPRLREGRPDLAVFAARYNDGRSWLELLKEWNRQHPTRRRDEADPQTFARDCRQAYERVTGQPLLWRQTELSHEERLASFRRTVAAIGPEAIPQRTKGRRK